MNNDQVLKDIYKNLPEDMRQAIMSVDLVEKFSKITEKHSLHIDQAGALQTETLSVMLGIESTKDYVGNLKKELEISESEARAIAEDVNSQIFSSIKQSLQKIQEDRETLEENEEEEKEENPREESLLREARERAEQVKASGTVQKPSLGPKPPIVQSGDTGTSNIERVGQFSIDKTRETSSHQYNTTDPDKETTLKNIEDPSEEVVDPYREQI